MDGKTSAILGLKSVLGEDAFSFVYDSIFLIQSYPEIALPVFEWCHDAFQVDGFNELWLQANPEKRNKIKTLLIEFFNTSTDWESSVKLITDIALIEFPRSKWPKLYQELILIKSKNDDHDIHTLTLLLSFIDAGLILQNHPINDIIAQAVMNSYIYISKEGYSSIKTKLLITNCFKKLIAYISKFLTIKRIFIQIISSTFTHISSGDDDLVDATFTLLLQIVKQNYKASSQVIDNLTQTSNRCLQFSRSPSVHRHILQFWIELANFEKSISNSMGYVKRNSQFLVSTIVSKFQPEDINRSEPLPEGNTEDLWHISLVTFIPFDDQILGHLEDTVNGLLISDERVDNYKALFILRSMTESGNPSVMEDFLNQNITLLLHKKDEPNLKDIPSIQALLGDIYIQIANKFPPLFNDPTLLLTLNDFIKENRESDPVVVPKVHLLLEALFNSYGKDQCYLPLALTILKDRLMHCDESIVRAAIAFTRTVKPNDVEAEQSLHDILHSILKGEINDTAILAISSISYQLEGGIRIEIPHILEKIEPLLPQENALRLIHDVVPDIFYANVSDFVSRLKNILIQYLGENEPVCSIAASTLSMMFKSNITEMLSFRETAVNALISAMPKANTQILMALGDIFYEINEYCVPFAKSFLNASKSVQIDNSDALEMLFRCYSSLLDFELPIDQVREMMNQVFKAVKWVAKSGQISTNGLHFFVCLMNNLSAALKNEVSFYLQSNIVKSLFSLALKCHDQSVAADAKIVYDLLC